MKTTLLTLIALAITVFSYGQAPEAFKYQAVVRDAGGAILTNQAVGFQLGLLQGSPSGTAVYSETFTPTTNNYGLVNIEIGTGTTVDDFTAIDWANGPYYIETAVDVTGGTSYSVLGTSQLLSVPYALHAATVDSTIWTRVNDTTISYNNVQINKTNALASEYDVEIMKYISPYRALNVGRGVNGIRFDFSTTGESINAYTTGSKQFYIGTVDSNNVNLKSNNITRLTVAGDGKISIGAPGGVPSYKLDVGTSDNFNWATRIWNTGGSGYGLLVKGAAGTSNVPLLQVETNVGTNRFVVEDAGKSTINDVLNLTPRATAPPSPIQGDIYFDSTLNRLMVFDGTIWQACW